MTRQKFNQIAVAALSIGVVLCFGVCFWPASNDADSTRPTPAKSPPSHMVFTPVALFSNTLPGGAQTPSFGYVVTNVTPIIAAPHPFQSNPAPGVYKATPYSMIVVVPLDMDSGIACKIPDNSQFNMPTIDPQIHLEKISPR